MAYRHWSIADHVWTHAGAEILITADVEEFFPSTLAQRVEDWRREWVGDPTLVRLLTLLTTYRGGLPQLRTDEPSPEQSGELRTRRTPDVAARIWSGHATHATATIWLSAGLAVRSRPRTFGPGSRRPCSNSGTVFIPSRAGVSTNGATNRK